MDRLITCEPLELEYLHTVLRDHDVTLHDGMTDRSDPVRRARTLQPRAVLISAHITNACSVHDIARRLKALPSPPYVFVGGPSAEVTPEPFFCEAVDGVFCDDALRGIEQTLARIDRGDPYDDIPGAAFPREGRFVRNPGPPLDPATLPIPDRVLLRAHPERYFYMYFGSCASVKTAFGCHEKCTFCVCTEQHGGRFGPRPLDQVVEEIAGIPVTNVFLLDDNFLSSPQRVLDFCARITARGLRKRFVLYGSADFIARNPEAMRRLRDAGAAAIITGFEFVTDEALASVDKRARLADNDRAIETCRDLGLELFALFVVDPGWRSEQFRRLRDYVRSRRIVHATFSTYTVFQGTALARQIGAPPPADGAWWRYDLLRLQARPRHMTALRYYLWLFYLYLLPSLASGTARRLRQLYGTWGFVRLVLRSWIIGVEYFVKLMVWR
jgi:radical SAM superfamily enzyme YgiQ (UPF0313 family)